MLTALDDHDGAAVDWLFVYKLPDRRPRGGSSARGSLTTGFEYLYFDSNASAPLALSPHALDDSSGALHRTLEQVFSVGEDIPDGRGWVLYNDEIPGAASNNEDRGHAKGVIAFDLATDSALWLLHSTPRWPLPRSAAFPHDERIYAQTYLCITLPDVATVQRISAQMRAQQQPQVYGCHIPPGLARDTALHALARGDLAAPLDAPSTVTFESRGGHPFESIAKSRHWGKDFWIDLVGPALADDLGVETWRRGTVPDTEDRGGSDHVDDVLHVDLNPLGVDIGWAYTKDHAKWAVGEGSDWVCVADLNRQVSQQKRGGGSICLSHRLLHDGLAKLVGQSSAPGSVSPPIGP
ncbi:MAG: deoxyribonuclease II family protein [Deltaproteobacteria bacterium]|nr:deoxyribonuclease II family protein [Deltaproteobacteria bacterium]